MGIFNVICNPLSIFNLLESVVDNCIRDNVYEPAIGSVVYCDLGAGFAEHSGIYIGKNRIVHLNGDGVIEKVSPKKFLNRLNGWNTAISIYVSCNNGEAVGSKRVSKLAKSMVGQRRNYDPVFDNCHQFTAGCLTGDFDNGYNFLTLLKDAVRNELNGDEWRVWNF